MTASKLTGLAAALCLVVPGLALGAPAAPNMMGNWTGKTFSIIAGSGGHWPDNRGTWEKPGLSEGDLVIAVTGQEGRRFWGVTSITANGKKTDEPFIGELYGKGNRSVLTADTDGYVSGQVNGNVFSFCYSQAGGPTQTSVVSCTELKRTPTKPSDH
jgi:hypothetical protein